MASVVCQGLQSCLETQLVEPLVLRHQLSPPKPSLFLCQNSSKQHKHEENSHTDENNEDSDFENDNKSSNKNDELGGWSFMQALTNTPPICKKESDEQKVYVHPLDKASSSTLSLKSLEMCTESLGSESGSDISESSDELSSLSWERKKIKRREFAKKPSSSASFPPPLTSISCSDGVRVKPHREGGRLVIRAVNFSSTSTYFQADRTNGRLRLSLLKDISINFDNEVIKNQEEEKVGEEVEEEEENENLDELQEEQEEELYGDEDEDEDEDDIDDDCWEEGMEGNSDKVGYENGINEELARPSRCKENNGSGNCKGMSIWGPYCVAIS